MEPRIRVFDYYPALDAFLCTPEFKAVAERLGLAEWTPVVWMGRLFARDQDFGEHWFDNWDAREALEKAGIPFVFPAGESWETLLVVRPSAFTEENARCLTCRRDYRHLPCPGCGKDVSVGADGPCTSDGPKKLFWTDVLRSLEVGLATLEAVARDYEDEAAAHPSHEPA